MSTAPDLIEIKEANPPSGTTLYFKIDLNVASDKGVKAKPMTGVFLPNNFAAGSELKLLVFLHGHYPGTLSINEYWTTFGAPKYQLRQVLNQSNKNYVFIAPTLSGESNAGDLVNQGGLKDYLDTVLEGLKKHASAKLATIPQIRNVYLAAHSGGGRPMLEIAEKMGKTDFDGTIKELWGLDCVYDKDTPYDYYKDPPSPPYKITHTDPKDNLKPTEVRWWRWAQKVKSVQLTMRYATFEPKTRCLNLKRLAAGDKFAKSVDGKPDGWDKILKFDGGTPVANVTTIESTVKDHELMVKPQLLLQLTT